MLSGLHCSVLFLVKSDDLETLKTFNKLCTIATVQLTAKFSLVCAIQACVVQFYSSDLSKLACHTRVRLLVLHSSQSQVLHVSQTLCILHVSKILHVKSGVLHGNKTWRGQSYSISLYCVIVLVYQIPVSLLHYSTRLFQPILDILHHGLNTCTATCITKHYTKSYYIKSTGVQLQIVVFCWLPLFQSTIEVIVSLLLSNENANSSRTRTKILHDTKHTYALTQSILDKALKLKSWRYLLDHPHIMTNSSPTSRV